jgi:hypothetical protein
MTIYRGGRAGRSGGRTAPIAVEQQVRVPPETMARACDADATCDAPKIGGDR